MNKYIVSSLMLLGCSLHAVESKIEIRNREAAGVGYSTGYSSLDYFLMTEGPVEFLLDLRGHVFNNGQGAGNAGLGFRYPLNDDKYLIGANAFYDIRQSPQLLCNQVGAGFEWISRYIDVRTNGYIPVGKQKYKDEKTFAAFGGRGALIKRKLKAALPCVDAEVGTPLPRPFYFAVGSYYLFGQSDSRLKVGSALGIKARAEADIGRYVTIGVAITYDRIFKTRPQGYISLNIPFEKKKYKKSRKDGYCYTSKKRNLRRVPIMRNEIIPIEDVKRTRDPLTSGKKEDGVRFMFVNNLAAADGDGSFEKPFASLKEAEKNSTPGDVIYIFPGDNTAKNMDEGIILKDKQILASSAGNLVIGEVTIPAQTTSRPHITNKHAEKTPGSELTISDFITNPGNSHLGDFYFIPPWDYFFPKNIIVDPFAEARDAGFEVLMPERPPPVHAPGLGGVAIIDNYERASLQPVSTGGIVHSTPQIIDEYTQ
jgi:hypothetical protein